MNERGRTILLSGVLGSFICLVLLAGSAAVAGAPQAIPTGSQICPNGYQPYDVRVYGQRLEEHQELVQNDWADDRATDPRYVVITACVRQLTNAENEELFRWGSQPTPTPSAMSSTPGHRRARVPTSRPLASTAPG